MNDGVDGEPHDECDGDYAYDDAVDDDDGHTMIHPMPLIR